MHPSSPSPKQIPEPAPDSAGLAPAGDGGTLEYPPAKRRTDWAQHPVTVKLIMALALPTIIEQVLAAAVGFLDTWVAGHTVVPGHTGTEDDARAAAAAAVGAMTYLQWFISLMTSTLATGAMAIVSRSIGAGRPRMANRVAGTSCAAAFIVGIAIAVLFYVLARPLARAFSLHGDAERYAVDYLRIMCWTVCFQSAGQVGMACLRGAGDTLRPMLVTLSIAVVNGIAAPALAWGWFGLPALGVRGNALGTLFAFAIAGVVTFAFLLYGNAGLKLRLRHLRIMPHLLRRVARIGVPAWFEGMMMWGGQLVTVMVVMGAVDRAIGRAGSGTTMAAHNATLRVESLAFLPGFGFGIAASALVGQYLGAKKPEEAHRAGVLCGRLAVITMTLAALPMIFMPHALVQFIVNSHDVVELGAIPLIIAGLAQPAFAVAIVKSCALKGAGETVWPLIATMTGMGGRIVILLGMMWYLVGTGQESWGLTVVWVCIFLDLLYRGIVMEIIFRRGKWKLKKV